MSVGFARLLEADKFHTIVAGLQNFRIDDFIKLLEKQKGANTGNILPFIRGLRFSALLIYAIRELITHTDLEVSWGHILDKNGEYRNGFLDYQATEDKNYGCIQGTPVLYNPLSFILLGNYDIAYITLIDSFKFAQRLFEPELGHSTTGSDIELFAPHTFQSFTGFTPHSRAQLEAFFYERLKPVKPVRKTFLGICNLKLNNGFLIGNGKNYLDAVVNKIGKVIKEHDPGQKIDHLLLHSFAWFDLSVLLFADDPQHLANVIQWLRRLTLENLCDGDKSLITGSLYRQLFDKQSKDQNPDDPDSFFKEANVFADTHTYIERFNMLFEEYLANQKVLESILRSVIRSLAK